MREDVYQSFYERVANKLHTWLDSAFSLFPNAVVALATLAFFWAIAKMAGHLVERTLAKMRTEDAASRLMATLVRLLVIGAGSAVALGVLNLDRAAASLLAGAGGACNS